MRRLPFAALVLLGLAVGGMAAAPPTDGPTTERVTPAPVPTLEPTPTAHPDLPSGEQVPRRWRAPTAPTPTEAST
jgi:hypothetical protein